MDKKVIYYLSPHVHHIITLRSLTSGSRHHESHYALDPCRPSPAGSLSARLHSDHVERASSIYRRVKGTGRKMGPVASAMVCSPGKNMKKRTKRSRICRSMFEDRGFSGVMFRNSAGRESRGGGSYAILKRNKRRRPTS